MVSTSKLGVRLLAPVTMLLLALGATVPPSCSMGATSSGGHSTFVIIGAGAAGLQWGILCKNAGIDYVILERGPKAGAFFTKFPRKRMLISVNKRYVGDDKSDEFALRHDWHSLLETEKKFGKFSKLWYPRADDLVRYMEYVAEDLNIVYDTNVTSTTWDADSKRHTITTTHGGWSADHLVVATGYRMRDAPACLGKEGVPYELHTYASFPEPVTESGEDDPFCKNKVVSVLGTGNAAFETVDMLAGCAANVHMIFKNAPRFSWKTHYVGDVRMHNGGLLDHYHLKSLNTILEDDGAWRRGDAAGCKDVLDSVKQLGVQSVVYAAGFTTQRDGIVNVTKGKFPNVGEWWSDPDQPNRWFAGSLMHKLDFRKSAGGFIHGFRYLVRAQFRHIRANYFGVPFPSTEFRSFDDSTALAIERIQNSSGLYQMSDFLVDLLVIRADDSVVYYPEVPMPWVDQYTRGAKGAMSIKMMFSDKDAWTWDLQWDDSRVQRKEGLFVHPVVTPYKLMDNGTEVEELQPHHIPEDVKASWASNDPLPGGLRLIDSISEALMAGFKDTQKASANSDEQEGWDESDF